MTRELPLFRHHHEPDDTALDPVNSLLDRIVDDARSVIDAGGEVALRARLARLLGGPDALGQPGRPGAAAVQSARRPRKAARAAP